MFHFRGASHGGRWHVECVAGTQQGGATRARPLGGRYVQDPTRGSVWSQPLEQVTEGMKVVDAAGAEIGTVEFISMGDPGAATSEGNDIRYSQGNLLTDIAEAISDELPEPQLPEPLRSRFLIAGFIKIDGGGLGDSDWYASSDMLQGVSEDTVRLKVGKDALAEEAS